MWFKTVTLSSWDDIHKYVADGWLFRGQRSSDWELLEWLAMMQPIPNRRCDGDGSRTPETNDVAAVVRTGSEREEP